MIGRLPKTLEVSGTERKIRTDFRDALVIMAAFNDPELTDAEKYDVMLTVLYEEIPDAEDYPEAVEKALWFLDCGQMEEDNKPRAKVMDWEQDEQLLFPAVNKVAGFPVRNAEYLHWWEFCGYFNEIDGDGTFSMVLCIRQKRAKGKKLEKWELEFYRNHKEMCDLKTKYTKEEQEEINYWNKLLG